jgi:carbon storage regulator
LVCVLVLTRKPKQRIMIGDDVEITLLSAAGGRVRLGIRAPSEVAVYRTEIYTEINRGRRAGTDVDSGPGDALPVPGGALTQRLHPAG